MAFAGFVHRPDLAKVLFLVTIFVVVPGWLTLAAVRQTRLDDALIAAIKAGKDEDALNALKAGAHPDSRDTAGQSPPSLRETFLEEIKRLLGGKRKPHPMGPTALMLAVEGNRTAVVKALLDRGAMGVNAVIESSDDYSGAVHLPLLSVAAKNGNVVMAQALLDRGANIRIKDEHGETALLLAASSMPDLDYDAKPQQKAAWEATCQQNTAVVRLLLAHGADPNVSDADGRWTALCHAAEHDNIEMMQALLEKGAHVNPKDGTEFPLVSAFDVKTLRFLLDHGADVRARRQYGKNSGGTAFIDAARRNDLEAMRLLLNRMGKLRKADRDDINEALALVALYGDVPSIKFLISKGADVNNATAGADESALLLAAKEESEDIVLVLLAADADPNADKGEDLTALMVAADEDLRRATAALLKHGARVDARDADGKTALMYAAESGNEEIVAMLLEAGARVNARDKKGKTALGYADHPNTEEGTYWDERGGIDDTIALLKQAGARR